MICSCPSTLSDIRVSPRFGFVKLSSRCLTRKRIPLLYKIANFMEIYLNILDVFFVNIPVLTSVLVHFLRVKRSRLCEYAKKAPTAIV